LKRLHFILDTDDSLSEETMKTKQEIYINVKVHEEIFKVIQQGLSFCSDFEAISASKGLTEKEEEKKFLQRKYDENLFKLDLILEIVKAANGILRGLCKNNENFQR